MPSEYGGGFWGNVGECCTSRRVPKGPINSRLANGWVEGFGGFGSRLKEFFAPAKQAPLPFEIRPIKVKEIWTKDENFGWTQVISIGLHVALIGLIVVPLFMHILPPSTRQKIRPMSRRWIFLRTWRNCRQAQKWLAAAEAR